MIRPKLKLIKLAACCARRDGMKDLCGRVTPESVFAETSRNVAFGAVTSVKRLETGETIVQVTWLDKNENCFEIEAVRKVHQPTHVPNDERAPKL